MIQPTNVTEADILSEIIGPDQSSLNAEAAASLLRLQFSSSAHSRMAELCDGANRGTLAAHEQAELESYRRVALLLDLLRAKAKASLRSEGDNVN